MTLLASRGSCNGKNPVLMIGRESEGRATHENARMEEEREFKRRKNANNRFSARGRCLMQFVAPRRYRAFFRSCAYDRSLGRSQHVPSELAGREKNGDPFTCDRNTNTAQRGLLGSFRVALLQDHARCALWRHPSLRRRMRSSNERPCGTYPSDSLYACPVMNRQLAVGMVAPGTYRFRRSFSEWRAVGVLLCILHMALG